jgi:hypothetical protein
MSTLTESSIPHTDYTPLRATQFYIPLIIQSVSQSLTYPMVAAIVSHGEHGVLDLAAFAQGQALMFVISACGGGLLTTGMVFARSKEGFVLFKRLNLLMTIALLIVQACACLPAVHPIIFQSILGLKDPMAGIAREVLFLCIPMQLFFFLRTPALTALYNARASSVANWATLWRIALTALLVPIFIHYRLVGYKMGLLAMTIPVFLEMILAQYLALPYIRKLEPATEEIASSRTQFLFTIPISFGGILLALSGFMVGAFIARAADAERMLAIHYVTMGIVNPVSYAAIRMQAVVLAFPPVDSRGHHLFRYAIASGLVLMILPLMGQIPWIAGWYFGTIQNLPAQDIPFAMRAMLTITILPIIQTIRGHAEGLAAWMRRPNAILAGQAVYLGSIVCSLFVCINTGVPGYLMGVISYLVAVSLTFLTVRMGLVLADEEMRMKNAVELRVQNDE